VDWRLALLKQNPFPTSPPRRPKEAFWAGFGKLRGQFENLLGAAFTTSRTQVILNWGEYGSGKTHAAVYFRRPDSLPSKQVRQVWNLYIQTPKEADRAGELFYQNIVEAIGFRRLRKEIRRIIEIHGDQNALEKLQEATESEILGKSLWLLGFERDRSGELSLFQEEGASEKWQRLLEAYFFSETTKGDLKTLGLSRGISSAQDRSHILGGLLRCLTGFAPTSGIEEHSRIILWIDELEDLIYYTARQHRLFTQGLCELIDFVPHYLTLLMNITLSSPEAFEDTTTVLGEAVVDRVTDEVKFHSPSEEEALEYFCDLVKHYRTEDPKARGLPDTYPFAKSAIVNLIANLPNHTPQDVNQRCSEVVRKALQRGIISGLGEGVIDKDFVLSLEEERIGRDMS
ncbi:hypothetical protein ACFL6S_12120, partial [Candidatus Poribacteria bacterium]